MNHLTRDPARQQWAQGTEASLDHVSTLIEEPPLTVTAPNGEPLLVYERMPDWPGTEDIRATIPAVYGKRGLFVPDTRAGGLKTRSATFGFNPRLTVRRDYCAMAMMSQMFPRFHDALCHMAVDCAAFYKDTHPSAYYEHMARVERDMKPCWRLPDTPYTGGIINNTIALTYHRDKGNVPNTWSAMVTLRDDGLTGGALVIPELDLAVGTTDRSVLLFQGERFAHGVSPLVRRKRKANRYTIVFYSLLALRHCGDFDFERERLKERRTLREKNRLAGVQAIPQTQR